MNSLQASQQQEKSCDSTSTRGDSLSDPTPTPTPISDHQMEHHEMESPEMSPLHTPEMHSEEPLYTEINIPLPPIPLVAPPIPPKSRERERAHTIHSASHSHSPFSLHRRHPSSPSSSPRASKEKEMATFLGEEKRVAEKSGGARKGTGWQVMMKEKIKGRKRNQTVDALAIVPAVLVLRAELFTPGKEAGVR